MLACVLNSFAQKVIDARDQTWLGYFNQTRITNKSGVWVDLHLRLSDDFVKEKSQAIGRIGYMYYLSDHTKLTAGYAFITQYTPTVDIPEHRPWQQIQWHEKKNGFNLMQWFRVEQRYRRKVLANELTDEYNFNWRLRYNFSIIIPLKGKQLSPGTPFIFLNNEVHINAGKQIVNNYFDQNRFFAGIGYQFTKTINAHLGYMNVFQQLPTAGQFANTHAIRLFIFQNIDLRTEN